MDAWHLVTNWLDHNRGAAAGAAMAALLALWLTACDVTTTSLTDPGAKVTPRQFDEEVRVLDHQLEARRRALEAQLADYHADVELLQQRGDAAREELQHKLELREQVLSALGGFAVDAAAGAFNPVSAVSAVITLLSAGLAVGLGYDNRRKDAVITDLKKS